MSATGRNLVGHERHADDSYSTPKWCTRAILPHVNLGRYPLDPCAGTGAILRVLRDDDVMPWGMELDVDRAAVSRLHGLRVDATDALKPATWCQPTGVITNPPYELAMDFVERALHETRGEVVMLLRLAFLESRGRVAFHRANPSDVFVLGSRPSFAHGLTDNCAYAWFVWRACDARGLRSLMPGTIRVLDDGPSEEEEVERRKLATVARAEQKRLKAAGATS